MLQEIREVLDILRKPIQLMDLIKQNTLVLWSLTSGSPRKHVFGIENQYDGQIFVQQKQRRCI